MRGAESAVSVEEDAREEETGMGAREEDVGKDDEDTAEDDEDAGDDCNDAEDDCNDEETAACLARGLRPWRFVIRQHSHTNRDCD